MGGSHDNHLRLLSIGHYLAAGCLVAQSAIGFIISRRFMDRALAGQSRDSAELSWMWDQLLAVNFGWMALAVASLVTVGILLSRRRWYEAVFVLSVLNCLMMPFGTLVGVLTLLVISQDAYKAHFRRGPGAAAHVGAAALDAPRKQTKVRSRLDMLGTASYVLAGVLFVLSFFAGMVAAAALPAIWDFVAAPGRQTELAGLNAFFSTVWGVAAAGGVLAVAWLALLGHFLRRKRYRAVCIGAAALSCLFVPIGTVIGVLTLLELLKPEAADLFADAARGRPLPT